MTSPTQVHAKKRRVGAASSTFTDGEDRDAGDYISEINSEEDMNSGEHNSFPTFEEDEEGDVDEDKAEEAEDEELQGQQGGEGEEQVVQSRHHDWMATRLTQIIRSQFKVSNDALIFVFCIGISEVVAS